MAYTPTQWKDEQPPAINATNLNKIEQGIKAAHDDLATHTNRTDNPHRVTRGQIGASQVVVEHGSIGDGGTIPLPSGYSQAECKWMVSMKNTPPTRKPNAADAADDPRPQFFECEANGSRQVSVGWWYTHQEGGSWYWRRVAGTANYIIIGVR